MYKYRREQARYMAWIHGQSARLSYINKAQNYTTQNYINKATIKQRVSSLTGLKATKQHPQNIWSFFHAKHNMQAFQSTF